MVLKQLRRTLLNGLFLNTLLAGLSMPLIADTFAHSNQPEINNQHNDDPQKTFGCTALHYAVKAGNLAAVNSLIGHIDLDIQEAAEGKTALHYAIEGALDNIALALIDAGANVNIASGNPVNPYPLHLAVVTNRKKIVEKLLRTDVLINQLSLVGGKTALHKAAEIGLFEIVVMLVKKRADMQITDNRGRTALHIAQERGWDQITAFLQRYGAKQGHTNEEQGEQNEELFFEGHTMENTIKAISYDLGIYQGNRVFVCALLKALIADEFVLYTKTLNAHWNVTGPFFGPLHALFKDNYEMLFQMIDDLAERSRTLGGTAPGSLTEFLSNTQLAERPGTITTGQELIALLYNDHLAIIRSLRTAIGACEKQYSDVGTANFLTDLMEKQEKAAWMLRAHLE